ncbi:maleylpyruvate isomerase N-terminal domain-containing protein [Variovorax sp. J22P240]|uniref:maleylpyruvate isomerase N-terminal domain-containing protein n=1 Tax=Variovorax sp. J22P240 TaxID=3053514 RepID=UPI00257848BD|nr:maleylpyruvate isomerase N-terminal domain-containing protein [Variovorax sp. J22P240]MDM0000771.1 maleylpyruvate isomerase N-terminal domain-containing protein [Variovorax sp. J22P240]
MHEIQCLNEEIEELAGLLSSLKAQDWKGVTAFQAWTVNDVVLHLYASDYLGIAATTSQEAFTALFGDMQRGREAGHSSAMETRLRFPSLNGQELFELWFAQAMELSKRLAAQDPVERLPWIGPPMLVSTFAAARQMETWAHGQEIYDLRDLERAPTDRLRPILLKNSIGGQDSPSATCESHVVRASPMAFAGA